MHVPVDALERWPRGGMRYVPVDRRAFESLVERLEKLTDDATRRSGRWTRGEYAARLEDGKLVGRARLAVDLQGPARLLPLAPCNVAVDRPQWADVAKPAVLGMTRDAGLAVLVERSGELEFDWRAAPRATTAERSTYALELPLTVVQRIVLDLPVELAPTAKEIVLRPATAAEQAATPLASGERRWVLEPGSHGRIELTLAPQPTAQTASLRQSVVRQAYSYLIQPRGVAVDCKLTFDALQDPPERPTLELGPGLQLLSATAGTATFRAVRQEPLPDGSTRVMLAGDAPLERGQTLMVECFAPLVLEKAWRLPLVIPREVAWQDATAEISIDDRLAWQQLNLEQAQQTSPLLDGTAHVQLLAAAAALEVRIGWRRATGGMLVGNVVTVADEELVARTVLDGDPAAPQPAVVRAKLTPGWNIDAVDASPAGGVEDWSLGVGAAADQLTIRLRRKLAEKPIRVTIRGRRALADLGESWPLGKLRMATFDDPALNVARQIMAVHVQAPLELTLTGDHHLRRLTRPLSEQDAALFDGLRGTFEFELDAGAATVGFRARRQNPRFQGDLDIQATYHGGRLTQRYIIRCAPQHEPLSRVVVQLARPPSTTLHWRLHDTPLDRDGARRLSPEEERARGLEPGGAAWEITLREPQLAPFVLTAEPDLAHAPPAPPEPMAPAGQTVAAVPLPLALLPGADVQTGRFTITSADGAALQITTDLPAVDAPSVPWDQLPPARAYAFRPARDGRPSSPPPATVALAAPPAQFPPAWIAREQVTSRHDPDGTTQLVVAWEVERSSGARLDAQWPAGVSAGEVWVDGVSQTVLVDGERKFPIDLPAGKRFACVVLRYHRSARGMGNWGAVTAPTPTVAVPILSRRWTAWVPNEYTLLAADRPDAQRIDSSTLLERWLGPVARDDAWSTDVATEGTSRSLPPVVRDRARDVVTRLEQRLAAARRQPFQRGPTWGEVLADLSPTLVLDRRALAAAAVTPRTPVVIPARPEDTGWGLDVLDHAGLALAASSAGVLLTSQAELLSQAADATPLTIFDPPLSRQQRVTFAVSSQYFSQTALAAEPRATLHRDAAPRWQEQFADAWFPWRPETQSRLLTASLRGWNSRTLVPGDASDTPQVCVVYWPVVQTAACGMFLCVAVAGAWWLRTRPLLLVGLGGVAAVVAAAIPVAYGPLSILPCGVLLGSVTAWVLAVALPRRAATPVAGLPPTVEDAPASLLAAPAFRALLVVVTLAALWCAGSWLAAQEPPRSATTAASPPRPLYAVLIPCDDQQRPVGDQLHVPEPLYVEMLRRVEAAGRPRESLVLRSEYQPTLEWSKEGVLFGSEILATFDVHALAASETVTLGFAPTEVALASGGVRIDGVLADAETYRWTAAAGLQIRLREAGPHRIELRLTPVASDRRPRSSAPLDIAIPPAPAAPVTLLAPVDAPPITWPGTSPPQVLDGATASTLELGPRRRLELQWSPTAVRRRPQAPLTVQELLWLNVRRGGPLLRGRWHVSSSTNRPTQIVLRAHPQLIALPPGQGSLVRSVVRATHDPRLLYVTLSEPPADKFTFEIEFLWPDVAAGIGQLRAPALEWQGDPVTQRWFAASIAPGLEAEPRAGESLNVVSGENFLAAWGAPDTPPRWAYRVRKGEIPWSVTTRQTAPRLEVDQTLALHIARQRIALRYRGEIVSQSGSQYQYTLQLAGGPPAGGHGAWQVRKVSLLHGDEEHAAAWSLVEGGVLTILLDRRAAESQQLLVEADAATPVTGSSPLPTITVRGAKLVGNHYEVRHHVTMQPTVREPVGLTPLAADGAPASVAAAAKAPPAVAPPAAAPPPAATSPSVGSTAATQEIVAPILLGRWRVDQERPTALLVWTNTDPQITATQSTTIRPAPDGAWKWQTEVPLQINKDILYVARFDVPAGWSPDLHIEPASDWYFADVPGENRRELVVLPRAAMLGSRRLTLAATIPAPDDHLVPFVQLRNAQVRRFLTVPSRWDDARVAWDAQGMAFSRLPTPLTVPGDLLEPLTFELIGDRARCTWQSAQGVGQSPQVTLADVHVAVAPHEPYHGVVAYDWETAGNGIAAVSIPPDLSVVQLRVGGRVTQPLSLADGVLRFPLAPGSGAERVELLFHSGRPVGLGEIAIPAPVDVPVQRTLWSIYSSSPAQIGNHGGEGLAEADYDRVHREQLARLAAAAPPSAAPPSAAPPSAAHDAPQRRWLARAMATLPAPRHVQLPETADAPPPATYVTVRLLTTLAAELLQREAATFVREYGAEIYRQSDSLLVWETPAHRADELVAAVEKFVPARSIAVSRSSALPTEWGLVGEWKYGLSTWQLPRRISYNGGKFQTPRPTTARSALLQPPWRWALATLVATLLGLFLVSRSAVRDTLAAHPHLLGVLAGVAWSLWAHLPWLGLLLAATSLTASLRPLWPNTPPPDASGRSKRIPV